MASFSSVTYGACALFHNSLGTNRFIRPLNDPARGTGTMEPKSTCQPSSMIVIFGFKLPCCRKGTFERPSHQAQKVGQRSDPMNSGGSYRRCDGALADLVFSETPESSWREARGFRSNVGQMPRRSSVSGKSLPSEPLRFSLSRFSRYPRAWSAMRGNLPGRRESELESTVRSSGGGRRPRSTRRRRCASSWGRARFARSHFRYQLARLLLYALGIRWAGLAT
jgi:hypothetical protein